MIIKKQAHESHLINLGKKIMKGSKKRMFTSVIKNAIILFKKSKTWMKLNKIIS